MAPPSSFLRQPPANEDDLNIIKGSIVSFGILGKLDPQKGLKLPGPPKPPPEHYHFESNASRLLITASISIVCMVLATSTRLLIRMWPGKQRLGWDDVFIVIGTITALTLPALSIVAVTTGAGGKHTYDITYHEYQVFLSLTVPRGLALYIPLSLVKISIVLFYMRLNSICSRPWMISHYTLLTFTTATLLTAFFTTLFQCNSVPPLFDVRLYATWTHAPKCLVYNEVIKGLNVLHILTDAALLVVPFVMLWSVQMSVWTKFRVWVMGIVGCVNIVLSICRIMANEGLKEVFYDYWRVNAWSSAELTLGVITASLPVLSVLITKLSSSLFASPDNPPSEHPSHHRRYHGRGNWVGRRRRAEEGAGNSGGISGGVGSRYIFEKARRGVKSRKKEDDSLELTSEGTWSQAGSAVKSGSGSGSGISESLVDMDRETARAKEERTSNTAGFAR